MLKIISIGFLFLVSMFNCASAFELETSDPCNKIHIVFLHDFEMVPKVWDEVAVPIENYFASQAEIEDVRMSIDANIARIVLIYKEENVGEETVSKVYEEVKQLMKKGTIPKYVQGPIVSGCGIKMPDREPSDEEKVYMSLEDALKAPGKVYKLDLHYNQLTELPESIGELKNLAWLRLEDNKLTTLPAAICELTNLRVLNIESNDLASLPAEFGKLKNLSVLVVEDNELSSFPESMGRLSNLKSLKMRYNQFSSLPDFIGDLKKLEFIDVAKNKLTTFPSSIGKLKKLDFVNACSNEINSLPTEMSGLVSLTTIYLSDNPLSEIPESMRNLSKLAELYMEVTNVSDEGEGIIETLLPNCKVKF